MTQIVGRRILKAWIYVALLVVAGNRQGVADDTTVPSLVQDGERWRFSWPDLEGVISGGHEHGIELTKGADGGQVTRPMCMNLEHYYSNGRFGYFVPRYKADVTSRQKDAQAVELTVAPYAHWPLRSTITYRLHPKHVIEAVYEFSFDGDVSGFEALISNYFHEPLEPTISLGGHWVQPKLTEQEHRFWMRSNEDVTRLLDGRCHSDEIKLDKNFASTIDLRKLDHPIMISPIRDTGWSVIHILSRDNCASLSANRIWKAHDFTLAARDAKQGDVVRYRAWMIYARLGAPAEVLGLQKALDSPAASE